MVGGCGQGTWLRYTYVFGVHGSGMWSRHAVRLCGPAMWLGYMVKVRGQVTWSGDVVGRCGRGTWLRYVVEVRGQKTFIKKELKPENIRKIRKHTVDKQSSRKLSVCHQKRHEDYY